MPEKGKQESSSVSHDGQRRGGTHRDHAGHDDHHKHVIGWSEHLDFPEWGIEDLRVKVDTGARTSALHVENLEILPGNVARFEVVLSRSDKGKRKRVKAPVVKHGRVRSSTGHWTVRYFVKTRIRVGPVEKEIEISLVSREKMMFRMLLGRKALERDFVVDVTKRHALSEPSVKSNRKKK